MSRTSLVLASMLALSLSLVTGCVTQTDDNDPDPGQSNGSGTGSGSGSGSGSGTGSGSGSDSGGLAMIPRTGQWYYADVTLVSSTCVGNEQGVSGGFVIDAASATGFHVIPGDGTAPFDCTLAGNTFDCPNRYTDVEDLAGLDAVITTHATADGTLSSAISGTGSQQATVTCTGADCAELAAFPCSFQVGFTIHAAL